MLTQVRLTSALANDRTHPILNPDGACGDASRQLCIDHRFIDVVS